VYGPLNESPRVASLSKVFFLKLLAAVVSENRFNFETDNFVGKKTSILLGKKFGELLMYFAVTLASVL